ncbi:hypothetical protein GCM10029978_085380 [Actinoallomurus acanthiterrae]
MTITTPPETRRRLRRGEASTRTGAANGADATTKDRADPPREKRARAAPKGAPKDTTKDASGAVPKQGGRTDKGSGTGGRAAARGTGAAKRGKQRSGGAKEASRSAATGTATARRPASAKEARAASGRTGAPAAGRKAATPASGATATKAARTATGTPTRRTAGSGTAARPQRRAPQEAAPPRGRAPFVLLIVGLLGGALVSLLLLNTVLAQDAFTLSELQRDNRQLAERKQALQADIARENDPEVLHSKALGLGMKDPQGPAFIDPRTGRLIEGGARPQGVSDAAVAAAAAGAVTGAPGALVPPADPTPPRRTTTAPRRTTGTAPHAKTATRQPGATGGGTR